MSRITEGVEALALPVAGELGLMLWDVEYVREGGERYLRILIDSKDGISIDQCEAFSKRIDPMLDESELISEQYILEVASAGMERALKKPEHFDMFIGENIELKLYKAIDNQKKYEGELASYMDGEIKLLCGGTEKIFKKEEVSSARLKPDFSKY